MNRLTDHLIIISFDCLSALDYPILKELPHFQKILQQGAYVKNVQSIYPSITYPCHTTIVTGNYPNRHGVIHNTRLQPGNPSPDWYWYRSDIKGTTLYDEAKNAKMKTAALLWPVTGKAKIDYNMPEIFPNRPWQNQVLVSLLNGSPLYQLELNRRFGYIRDGLAQPELDEFVLESTVHTITTKKPNLLMVHFTELDTMRHHYGFSSEEAITAIHRHDVRLGKIINALKLCGIFKKSTVVVLGDHSALDENRALYPNVLFHKHGLISTNSKGKLIDWKAYCKSSDGSAYIYVKDPKDTVTMEAVRKLLYSLLNDPSSGIENVLTNDKSLEKGADGNCAFMVEAQKGSYFLEDYNGEYMKTILKSDVEADHKYTLATHGYSPEKANYGTILIAAGKGIRKTTIPEIRLVDEGPTFARLLGLNLGDTDGRIIEELLTLDGRNTNEQNFEARKKLGFL